MPSSLTSVSSRAPSTQGAPPHSASLSTPRPRRLWPPPPVAEQGLQAPHSARRQSTGTGIKLVKTNRYGIQFLISWKTDMVFRLDYPYPYIQSFLLEEIRKEEIHVEKQIRNECVIVIIQNLLLILFLKISLNTLTGSIFLEFSYFCFLFSP